MLEIFDNLTRKDLRIKIACELYKRDEISFGKACEIASLNIEEMKEILYRRGIERHVNVSLEEMENMAENAGLIIVFGI